MTLTHGQRLRRRKRIKKNKSNKLEMGITHSGTKCACCLMVLGPGDCRWSSRLFSRKKFFCSQACHDHAYKHGCQSDDANADGVCHEDVLSLIQIRSIVCRRYVGCIPIATCDALRQHGCSCSVAIEADKVRQHLKFSKNK